MEDKLTLSTLYRAQIQVEGKILQTMPHRVLGKSAV